VLEVGLLELGRPLVLHALGEPDGLEQGVVGQVMFGIALEDRQEHVEGAAVFA